MFIGHFAVGFAGKKAAPNASLAALLLAALFADVLWPVLVAIGAEEVRIAPGATVYTPLEFVSYPWSHSLLMLIIWGALFAAYYRGKPDGARTGFVLGLLVVSHWVLDWITHKPDMPLWPGSSPRFGLGLWNSIPLTLLIEGTLWIVAIVLYLKGRPERSRGRIAFWSLVARRPTHPDRRLRKRRHHGKAGTHPAQQRCRPWQPSGSRKPAGRNRWPAARSGPRISAGVVRDMAPLPPRE